MMDAIPSPVKEIELPSFIRDEATTEDFFGSHKGVADSIASVIRKDTELRVIGLLGPWGSGKSTALRILKSLLDGDGTGKFGFFLYDAWVHQSDPPRRSFLETLVNYLVHEKLTTKEEWQDELDRLSRRIEEHDTRSTPTLTFSGKIIAATLLAFPIGLALMSPFWLDKAFAPFGISTGVNVLPVGVILLLAPFVAGLLVYATWRPTLNPFNSNFWKKKNWSNHRAPHQNSAIFSIFVNKAIDRVTNRVIRAPDPTAIEFQETYQRVMRAVSLKRRRYIFVIDNLDRIPESEAVALWSTIRSFFLSRGSEAATKPDFTPPIVILPLDPSAVRRIYGQSGVDADELAQSFLDKTFDLIFRVAPPVLSDWHAYLSAKLKEAFGRSISEQDIYVISKLFAAYLVNRATTNKKGQHVTPRMIIKLVNSMATLRLRHGSECSYYSIAYYAIHRSRIEENIETILSNADADIDRFESDWRASVAAIYYGVPREKALQVLIGPTLEAAIAEANFETFSKLSIVPGFDSIFENCVDDRLNKPPVVPEFLTNAAYLIGKTQIPSSARLTAVEKNLRAAMNGSAAWEIMSPSTAVGITYLLASSAAAAAEAFEKVIALNICNVSPNFLARDDSAVHWAAAAAALIHFAHGHDADIDAIRVPGEAKFFLSVLEALSSDDEALSEIRAEKPTNEIVNQFAATATGDRFNERTEKVLSALLATRAQWPWQPLVSAAGQYIQHQPVDETGTVNAIRCLGLLRKHKESGSTAELKRLSTEGHLFNRLHEAHVNNHYKAEAAILTVLLLEDPTFTKGQQVGNSEAGFQLATNLTSTIADRPQLNRDVDQYLREYGYFTEAIDAASKLAVVRLLIQQIFTNRIDEGRIGALHIKDVIGRLPSYVDLLPKPQQELFIRKLPSYNKFWVEFEAASFDQNVFTILEVLISFDDEIGQRARQLLLDKASEFTRDSWQKILESGTEPLGLTLKLIELNKEDFEFGEPLLEALQRVFEKALAGPQFSIELLKRWFALGRALNNNRREILFKEIRDRILSGQNMPNMIAVLDAAGAELLTEGQFKSRPDDAVRYILIPLLSSASGIEWMSENKAETAIWVANADEGTRGYVSEKLGDLASRPDQPEANRIEELAAAWHLILKTQE